MVLESSVKPGMDCIAIQLVADQAETQTPVPNAQGYDKICAHLNSKFEPKINKKCGILVSILSTDYQIVMKSEFQCLHHREPTSGRHYFFSRKRSQ